MKPKVSKMAKSCYCCGAGLQSCGGYNVYRRLSPTYSGWFDSEDLSEEPQDAIRSPVAWAYGASKKPTATPFALAKYPVTTPEPLTV